MKEDPNLMTTAELAAKLRITRTTLVRWIKPHGIPCYRVGRKYMFSREEIDKWVADHHITHLDDFMLPDRF